jgi:hypothetical protein
MLIGASECRWPARNPDDTSIPATISRPPNGDRDFRRQARARCTLLCHLNVDLKGCQLSAQCHGLLRNTHNDRLQRHIAVLLRKVSPTGVRHNILELFLIISTETPRSTAATYDDHSN